jgi:hypothetical protein
MIMSRKDYILFAGYTAKHVAMIQEMNIPQSDKNVMLSIVEATAEIFSVIAKQDSKKFDHSQFITACKLVNVD